jgi:hypothetical protein
LVMSESVSVMGFPSECWFAPCDVVAGNKTATQSPPRGQHSVTPK